MRRHRTATLGFTLLIAWASAWANAQTPSTRMSLFGQRMMQVSQSSLPADTRVFNDIKYGDDPRQRLDVYAPARASHAPVILMVHGGAWAFGDKSSRDVVINKAARWIPRGFILVSVDYRMLPEAAPLAQADDVARALAFAQRHARDWGGDPAQFIVMGHSAGAHLAALISTDTAITQREGVTPWLGTIALDSAALDVAAVMQQRHLPLYDRAFGNDAAGWAATSPYQQMHARIEPFLAVCSTRRAESCPQAQRFVAKAAALGSKAKVLPEDLAHEQINERLGGNTAYTSDVETFMRELSPVVAQTLQP